MNTAHLYLRDMRYGGKKAIEIYGCPGAFNNLQVLLEYGYVGESLVKVTMFKTWNTYKQKEYKDNTIIDNVAAFCNGVLKHITALKELIGFIPYYDITENGDRVYVPEDVFLARQKPVEMCGYHKVQIPKAFMNEIAIAKEITDALEDETAIAEPMTGEWHDMLIPTLKKLTSGERFTLSDIRVFDYIGIIHIVAMGRIFINGDKIYQDTDANRILCGNIAPHIIAFNIPRFPVGEEIPKSIIELGRVYRLLCETIRLSNHPDMGYELVLAAQLFAEKHCRLKF